MSNIETSSFPQGPRRRRHSAHLAVKARFGQTAREVADAKEANDLPLHLVDEVISQERVHGCYQMQHLSKNDEVIEWVARLLVLGLLLTTIWWQVCCE
jgi:hypothetical protein